MKTLLIAVALVLARGPGLTAQNPPETASRAETGSRPIRNPSFLRAAEVLERREPGRGLRVRFEWEQVSGATSYVLSGRWTDAGSWETRSMEVRVTAESAERWDEGVVVVELQLAPGSHSWSVVAGNDRSLGDLANPARHTFEIR